MRLVALTLAAAVFATPALAQEVKPPVDPAPAGSKPEVPNSPTSGQPTADTSKLEKFATIDTDKNGSLSMAELKTYDVQVALTEFERFDTNDNKELSVEEYRTFLVAQTGTAGETLPQVPPTKSE